MSRLITFAGETKSIRAWWQDCGEVVPLDTVYKRMQKGWSIYRACTKKPSRENNNPNGNKPVIFVTYEGKARCPAEIAEMTGWCVNTIRTWIRAGKPIRAKHAPPPILEVNESMTVQEIQIQNLLASGENYESIAKRIRSGEIV